MIPDGFRIELKDKEDVIMKEKFYIVREDALPYAMHKVLKAKQLLDEHTVATVKEATEKVGISRSVYYKYQHAIYPFYEQEKEQTITVTFDFVNKHGILSSVSNVISEYKINILTINMTIPINNIAHVTMTLETNKDSKDTNELFEKILTIKGVRKYRIIGSTSK